MTFSLVARCARTGMFGVAVSSSSPAVAARCAHVRAGVGGAATQNVTDPRLGPLLLDRLHQGMSASAAVAAVRATAPHAEFRQLTVVDRHGGAGAFSGSRTLGRHRTVEIENAVAAGNLLASVDVPAAMIDAFTADTAAHLGDRLVAALRAALAAGGEEGPVHSAGVLIVDAVPWPIADLRIDWSDDPIGDLARLWTLWKPQIDDYLTRALDPARAPGYGVPGHPRENSS